MPSPFSIVTLLFAGTDTWTFHPTTGPEVSSRVGKVLHHMKMECSTGNIEIRGAVRYSSDGEAWDSPVDVDLETRSTDGTTYGTAWCDVRSGQTRKRLIQRGFKVRRINQSANTEVCRAYQAWDDDATG